MRLFKISCLPNRAQISSFESACFFPFKQDRKSARKRHSTPEIQALYVITMHAITISVFQIQPNEASLLTFVLRKRCSRRASCLDSRFSQANAPRLKISINAVRSHCKLVFGPSGSTQIPFLFIKFALASAILD